MELSLGYNASAKEKMKIINFNLEFTSHRRLPSGFNAFIM